MAGELNFIYNTSKGPHRRSGQCIRFCSDSDICVAHARTVLFQLFQVAVLSDAEICHVYLMNTK